ncbi:hypothetical protein F4821DRAFT_239404 [Hypoxylon rubiginosum]|uniref:Uncharacterized protein n=1 Tax=Hypoxylon rubiginosum TaxID=110542 RepID=A0ACC0CZN0_9PEZI|nr:hypothetical protein F4821DRAFT_239404 [Hypoxylon rubiginosum]
MASTQSNYSCAGISYSTSTGAAIPSNNTVGIATYRPTTSYTNGSVEDEYIWKLMQGCCSPNAVAKLPDDCVLWCDLPPLYVDDHEGFFDCVDRKNLSYGITTVRNATGTSDGGSGAAVMTGGRPSVMGMGVLALMVGWFCLLA